MELSKTSTRKPGQRVPKEDREMIWRLHTAGSTIGELAVQFNVTHGTVSKICREFNA